MLVGVRQSCILSLNMFLEFVLNELKSLKEFQLDRELATDIRYADDTTLLPAIFEKLKPLY